MQQAVQGGAGARPSGNPVSADTTPNFIKPHGGKHANVAGAGNGYDQSNAYSMLVTCVPVPVPVPVPVCVLCVCVCVLYRDVCAHGTSNQDQPHAQCRQRIMLVHEDEAKKAQY